MSKGFFIDTTRCVACKACQVACKQWHNLPSEQTENTGTYQNPPDFSPHTYKLVRMNEVIIEENVRWLFFPDQCRHCLVPPCQLRAQNQAAIFTDEKTGAVVFTEDTRHLKARAIIDACPYNVPRSDDTGALFKCTMCNDRIKNGALPACVKTCPTGALNFGELADMRRMAAERLAKVKPAFPQARLLDPDEVRVIFLTAFAPENYHSYAASFEPNIWKSRQQERGQADF